MSKFLTALVLWLLTAAHSLAQQPVKGVLTPADPKTAAAHQVTIGFYPISVYELDMGSNTFYADLYVWLRWKGNIDPVASLEFTNMVDEWGKQQQTIQEKAQTLSDGSKYIILKVEGRFVQPFNFASYPLDKHKLSIIVEDSQSGAEDLSFVIDQQKSGIGSNLQIPGWSLGGWSAEIFKHDYGSNMGEDGASTIYSTAQFNIHIERPRSYFYSKLLMPLLIVLTVALSALFLAPRAIDARTALPGGALLTAVFLQMSYSDSLPQLAYLVLMDEIYLVAFILIVATLVRAIVTFQRSEKADAMTLDRIMKTDKILVFVQFIVFMVATFLLIQAK
jgi:hypothetical protein